MRVGTETSVIVPEIWSRTFYDVLLATLPFADLLDHSYEGEINDLGDTVNISTIPEFAEGTVLGEADRNDADSVTITQNQLVINNRVAKDFIVTRRSQLQSIAFMDKVKERAIYSILKRMQTIIVAAIIPSAATPDHQIAYDTGSTLVLADMLEGKELLDTADVDGTGRQAVLGPAQMNDIFNISSFTSSDFLLAGDAGAPLASGKVPPLVGFAMSMTTDEVGNTSFWFHPSFMTLAVQDQLRINEYDLGVDGKRATRVNVDLLFGLDQLDDERVVTIS